MFRKALNRMREPSTWAGLSVLALMFGVKEVEYNAVAQAVSSIAAAASVFMPEQK